MQGSNNYVVQLFLFIQSSLNYIFLSQSSRTCDDTNLSLYNFPSLLLSPSLDVIHEYVYFFSHSLYFYLSFNFTFSLLYPLEFQCHSLCGCGHERTDHSTEDIFRCVHAHSARSTRVCVSGLCWAETGGWAQDRSNYVHCCTGQSSTAGEPGHSPDIILPLLSSQKPTKSSISTSISTKVMKTRDKAMQ